MTDHGTIHVPYAEYQALKAQLQQARTREQHLLSLLARVPDLLGDPCTLEAIQQQRQLAEEIRTILPRKGGLAVDEHIDAALMRAGAQVEGLHARVRELKADNTALQQQVEWLTVLAEGCPQHSSYRAKKFVTTTCPCCNLMIEARRVLAKLDGHHQEGEDGSAG